MAQKRGLVCLAGGEWISNASSCEHPSGHAFACAGYEKNIARNDLGAESRQRRQGGPEGPDAADVAEGEYRAQIRNDEKDGIRWGGPWQSFATNAGVEVDGALRVA